MTSSDYLDASLPISDRVDRLLSHLTIEEKAGQLSQYFYFGADLAQIPPDIDISLLPPDIAAFLAQPKAVEEAIANGVAGSVLFVKDAINANRLQKLAVDKSRLGIPLLFGFDVIHGLRTIFPVPIAQAASWDPEGVAAAQTVAAREARAVGIHWTFAPMIDIARDPRWGRIIEGAGEDPHLASAMAAAQVQGFQGSRGRESVLATPKHFAGYGAARGGRDYDDAEVSDSELHNVYLPPFRAAIDAGAATVMTAYMDLNGVPASANGWLLTDMLRGEFQFDGFVVSDANAVRSLETQHYASDAPAAAARAISAGLDMEMTIFDPAFSSLPEAVARGAVDESVIDRAVRRVLTAKFELGLFEKPYVDEDVSEAVLRTAQHRELARMSAERSIVLLKNDGTLPLKDHEKVTIAVVGQLAKSKRDTLGPWVFAQDTDEAVSILDGLRTRAGDAVTIDYASGAGIPPRVYPSPFDRAAPVVVDVMGGDDYDDEAEIERAVSAAAAADVAIVVVGERQNQIGESASRSTLHLPGRLQEQLERITETGTPVVLLVMSGRPLDLRWANDKVAAIAQVWYPGTRGGDAVAGVLFGDTSPAGRLPFTWPRHVGQVPMIYSHLRTFAPDDQDKRYWNEESTPLYPFGHGLSYASLNYTNLRLERDEIEVGESLQLTVDVTNASDTKADDVVQLYIHQRHGTSSRPVRELKGFHRVTLAARQTRTVSFELGPDQLTYWSAATRSWIQDATDIDVWVGGSSTADLATHFTVSEPDR